MSRAALLLACAFFCAAAGDPPAEEPRGGFFGRVWNEIAREIEQAAAKRARVPPTPVEVSWQKRKLGSFDFRAPLLALEARDLDGDGRAELVGLTTREVLVLESLEGKLAARTRAPLPTASPGIRSRDPIGSVAFSGADVLVRTSDQAEGAAFRFENGLLAEARRLTGFPLCPGAGAELVPGRNFFDDDGAAFESGQPWPLPESFYAAGCPAGLVDREGYPLDVFGVVDLRHTLTVRCRAAEGRECPAGPVRERTYDDVGYAFAVADLDGDGNPEVITSDGDAPGEPDQVTVYGLRDEAVQEVFAEAFQGGLVGLAAGDIDGEGAVEVVSAVRLIGSTRVDLWVLN